MSTVQTAAITNARFVPLRDLTIVHKNWKNPRTVTGLDEASILDLGKDIKARKLQNPLTVQKVFATPDKDPNKVINLVLAGQRRYLACEEVFDGNEEIPVVDRTVEPIDLTPEAADALMLDMLSEVTRREGLSAYELSEVADQLRSRGRTLAEIAKAIGRDESWVSKILTARKNADPKLMLRWRKGEITEEQFKDLATIKDPGKQQEALKETIKARESGDAAEARIRAKELAEQYKREQKGGNKPAPSKPPAATPRAVTGEQADMFDPPAAKKPAPAVKPESSALKVVVKIPVIAEMIEMADKRPPTSDYVKGIIDCATFMVGQIDMADFKKAWHVYVARLEGKTAKKAKSKAKATKKKAGKKGGKKAKRK